MADMKPPDRAAGSERGAQPRGGFRGGRRTALRALTAGAALLAGCAPWPPRGAPASSATRQPADGGAFADFLVAQEQVRGGYPLAPGPVRGVWTPPPGPFLALVAPVAAAARGADVFVVDAGHGALFHYDRLRQTLRRFVGVAGRPGMKLAMLGDLHVLVLDPAQRRLLRFNRDGALVARLEGEPLLAGATDLAADDATGTLWLADATASRLVAVRPALTAAAAVPVRADAADAGSRIAALAWSPEALYALDAARGRILRLDAQGRMLQSFGETVLWHPRAIAADRHGRVFVADAREQTLHVFAGGRHAGAVPASALGAAELGDLRVHDDDLAIADPLGSRVHVYRVRGAPRTG
jgi:sugar lactone lactonase YvrE